ncbi:MAG TPA: hypothetical protein VEH04_02210 [Verrucomicrobiae bacterium]|nr:hypothetical protein [Verrucomicrobiae bacterium]
MKPRSDTNSKAQPQRRASEVGHARNAEHEENRKTNLSKDLKPGKPADRSAAESESTVQGSEFK